MGRVRSVVASLSLTAKTKKMSGPAGLSVPGTSGMLRLPSVPGSEVNRVNDVLLLRPETASRLDGAENADVHVVFFPGDIQNFQQEMASHPDSVPWQSWSLERVASILGQRFPDSYIWVVRACSMYLHKFSSYKNFVESNLFGAPEHSPDYGAIRHLRALLSHSMERAALPSPADFSLRVVGFSKGCVVLNQMVYEMAGARGDPELKAFLERVSHMYWLDGGHPGGSETWVTDRMALAELAGSGVAVHSHVTPYEVKDPMRAWVGSEHQRFLKTLEDLGACPSHKLHFEDEPASIENHFRVLLEF